jgi:hypothetical protein
MTVESQAPFQPAPTPASFAPRTPTSNSGGAPIDVVVVVPSSAEVGAAGRRRVRLLHDVLVRTAPDPNSPRPTISLLGAGMIADLLDTQGEWVLIEFGPLKGWTRAESVEPIG